MSANLVYFIQSGTNGPIKVGTTTDIDKRLFALQAGNPERLVLMATTPGGHALERELHALLARGALGREWFKRDTPGLMETVEHILRHGTLPSAPEQSPDGASCLTCGWPKHLELAERGVGDCWRCLTEKAAA